MNPTTSGAAPDLPPGRTRTVVVTAVMVVIALAHALRVGTWLRGSRFRLYYAYFSDIAIPFGVYLLLCLRAERVPFLQDWRARAALVFGAASFAEAMQAFGVPLLGRTFDPIDIAMYGAGILLAVFVDRVLLARLLPGWAPKSTRPSEQARATSP